jgi:hypothetical protein
MFAVRRPGQAAVAFVYSIGAIVDASASDNAGLTRHDARSWENQ